MFLADTLSRACVPDICACKFSQHLEGTDHASSLALDHKRLQRIRNCSRNDPVIAMLCETIQHGWLEQMCRLPECIHPYHRFHDVMMAKSTCVQEYHVRKSMRKEIVELANEAHIGMRDVLEGPVRAFSDQG